MEYDKQITDFENLNSAQITFTNSFVQYNENQTLENYINLKSAHSDFEFYKLKFLTNYPIEMVTMFKNEILSNVITTKVPQFESVEKFEKVITLREVRYIEANKLFKLIKQSSLTDAEKMNCSNCLSSYLVKLDKKELKVKVDEEFPAQTYKKLPVPNALKQKLNADKNMEF